MRKPFVAGNWKMNKTAEQATLLVADLLPKLQSIHEVERVLCPPFTSLMVVSQMLGDSGIGLGAQNMHWEESGAFTGEVSPLMIKEFCQYVILGHSERRAHFHETDEMINRKVKSALQHGLIPILCVGETLEENKAGQTQEVVTRQVNKDLEGIENVSGEKLVIAYEPVWAIGTGLAASPEDAEKVIGGIIRKLLSGIFDETIAQKIRILYGGSVTGQNAREFFQEDNVDGALVGGASLKPDDFIKIVQDAVK